MSGVIGTLRQRVTLQRENPTGLDGGSYDANWIDVATVWARVEPLVARERLQAARLESRVTHRIILRYRADVRAGMRALWDGHVYAIQGVVDPGAMHKFIHVLAIEGGAV